MSDAPMTPSELANKFAGLVSATRASLLGKTEWEYDTFAAEKLITDRDAAIRQQAQAEALEQAAESIDRRAAQWQNVDIKAELVNEAITVRALLPIPNYRERIVLEARIKEAEYWEQILLDFDVYCGAATIAKMRAELARLVAADAEKTRWRVNCNVHRYENI